MKTVLYILRTRSELIEIFNFHKENDDAHKEFSLNEHWIEFKDGYKVWYKTVEEVTNTQVLKGRNYDEIVAPTELKNTDYYIYVMVPCINRQQKDFNLTNKITWT